MTDGEENDEWEQPRRMSTMGVEIEPDLEAPLLGSLESLKPQSRVAPILVLLAFIVIVIALASMMGKLSSEYVLRNTRKPSTQIP